MERATRLMIKDLMIREKPNTLKGKLQRGHGAGYIEALQTPPEEITPVLLDCICNDPRLDQQYERRSSYYASLIIKNHTNISGLSDYLRKNDDIHLNGENNKNALGILLILATLGLLAKKGNRVAVQILHDYISYGGNWCCAVSNLIETEEMENLEGIDRAICCRYKNDDDLIRSIEAQYWVDIKFFNFMRKSNARLVRIAEAPNFESWNPNTQEPEETKEVDYASMSLGEAFGICDNDNRIRIGRSLGPKLRIEDVSFLGNMILSGTDCQKVLAAYCLGIIGTQESFLYLKDFFEDISLNDSKNLSFQQRSMCFQAIHEIANAPPEICLETGRKWVFSSKYPKNAAGWNILKKHATIDDIPMLKKTILNALEDEENKLYIMYSAMETLWNFENIGLISEVEQVYQKSICSLGRRKAAEMMSDLAPVEFSAKYAYECLYDCEDVTKLLGIEFANISDPAVYQRLDELAEDGLEDEKVRQEAKGRLF